MSRYIDSQMSSYNQKLLEQCSSYMCEHGVWSSPRGCACFSKMTKITEENRRFKEEMATHELKCKKEFFDMVKNQSKRFEVRKNDRKFNKNDTVKLLETAECECGGQVETGNTYNLGEIKFILTDTDFPDGIKEGYAILGF